MFIASKRVFLLCVVLMLVACGGGSSSSDSSSDNRLSGSQQLTIRASGIDETDSGPFDLTLNGDSIFITDNGDPAVTASGTLSGANFSATGNSMGVMDGISCTFIITYTGTIVNNNATGTI